MAGDDNDTVSLLKANIVYASKDLDVNDLEYDQECTYRTLPGKHLNPTIVFFVTHSSYVCHLYFDSEFIHKTMIAIQWKSLIVM